MGCAHDWKETGNKRVNKSSGNYEFEVKCSVCNETRWVEEN